jgi:hypothetical protein
MSEQKQDVPAQPRSREPGAGNTRQLGVLVMSFRGRKSARKARRTLDAELHAREGTVLDSTVVEVNAKHKAFGYDPHRLLPGTLVPALTWGLFGLVLGSSGWVSGVVWAVIGGVCGGLFSYYSVTHLSKHAWARIGGRLPANSSTLAVYAEIDDVRALLEPAGKLGPTTASVAGISADLSPHVFAGPGMAVEVPNGAHSTGIVPDGATIMTMVMLRYPGAGTAKQIASSMAEHEKKAGRGLSVEVFVESDADGHLHVVDPKYGSWGWAKSDLVSWGLFGVGVGLLSGLISGGLFGAVDSGITTGLIWAAFGLFAGALYGLWAGRAVSARRLESARRLLSAGTSMVVAWSEQPITGAVLTPYVTTGSRHVVLRFNSIEGGVVLEAG